MRHRLCLIVIVLAFFSGLVTAQEYPERADPYVNDYAELLSPTEEDSLRDLAAQIAPEFDLTILTIHSTDRYDPSLPSVETFATKLFNEWGIGSAEKNTGVLILIVLAEQGVRIELGSGYGHDYDDAMQNVIDQSMLPLLGDGEIAEGLIAGVKHLYREITGHVLTNTTSFIETIFTGVVGGIRQALGTGN